MQISNAAATAAILASLALTGCAQGSSTTDDAPASSTSASQPAAGDKATGGTDAAAPSPSTEGKAGSGDGGLESTTAAGYITYDEWEAKGDTFNGKGPAVLFFTDAGCDVCAKAEASFKKGPIPEGLSIVPVPMSSAGDTAKKYDVTEAGTFVYVEPSGKQIKKWSGETTLETLKKQLG